jgi:hypothetical protein
VHGTPRTHCANCYAVLAPPFDPVAIRTARDAEENARRWLAHRGFQNCVLTGNGADEGVDVRGDGVVAQVKAQIIPVALDVVQRTYGCAMAEHALAAVFGLQRFTAQSRRWADTHGVALFSFDLAGSPTAENSSASEIAPR